jgi:hypothetical protein
MRLAFTLTLVGHLLVSPSVQSPSKPIKVDHISTSFRAPPYSLNEMVSRSDAVVLGRVVGGAPHDIRGTAGDTRPGTQFRFKIHEILHASGSHSLAADEISVMREGGDRDHGSHIVRSIQDGFPPFDVGHEYVLFLYWNSTLNDWVSAWGPDGAWDLTRGWVESAGSARVTNENRGKRRSDVLDLIRRSGAL